MSVIIYDYTLRKAYVKYVTILQTPFFLYSLTFEVSFMEIDFRVLEVF